MAVGPVDEPVEIDALPARTGHHHPPGSLAEHHLESVPGAAPDGPLHPVNRYKKIDVVVAPAGLSDQHVDAPAAAQPHVEVLQSVQDVEQGTEGGCRLSRAHPWHATRAGMGAARFPRQRLPGPASRSLNIRTGPDRCRHTAVRRIRVHIDPYIVIGSAVVGLLVGMTGAGGGALMTPMLILLFRVKPSTAISSDLVAAVVMRPFGAAVHLRKGTVNLGLVGLAGARIRAGCLHGRVPAPPHGPVHIGAGPRRDGARRGAARRRRGHGAAALPRSPARVSAGWAQWASVVRPTGPDRGDRRDRRDHRRA